MPSNQPPEYAHEARKRAHELRALGMSQRQIANEIGVAQSRVHKYLQEPVLKPSDHPLVAPLSRENAANVRKVQGVWPDPYMHFPDKGVITPTDYGLFDTDDEPACICAWVLNARHIHSGLVKIWLRSPELEGKSRTRMRWLCPIHNPILAENQSRRTSRVAPPSIFCYRFHEYAHADSARRAAHRHVKNGSDGSYILVSRVIGNGRCWDMASALNLTRRKASYQRAGTIEADKDTVIPLLGERLRHLSSLRKVTPKHLWRASDEETEEQEDREIQYEVLASGTTRTIAHISEKVIGRHVEHNDYVSSDEWASLTAYISRDKGSNVSPSDAAESINFDMFGVED